MERRNAAADVVCAGIVVADLFVPPLPGLPRAGELLATEDFLLNSGGCAVNTAACLVKLGVAAGVAGMVGRDSFGAFLRSDLRRKGINTAGLRRSAAHGSSKTVILPVQGEDRRFIHTVGANAALSAATIERGLHASTQVLYLGGYGVLPGLRARELEHLFRAARARGVRTVLDVVIPAGSAPHPFADLAAVLAHVDVFLPNAAEAQVLTGLTHPHDQARCFLAAGCGTVIITAGAQGALLRSADLTIEADAPSLPVVDSSGAGDAFSAGFIVGLLEGWEAARALRFASVLGASACTQLGCIAGVFARAEAEAYLRAHPLELRTVTGDSRSSVSASTGQEG